MAWREPSLCKSAVRSRPRAAALLVSVELKDVGKQRRVFPPAGSKTGTSRATARDCEYTADLQSDGSLQATRLSHARGRVDRDARRGCDVPRFRIGGLGRWVLYAHQVLEGAPRNHCRVRVRGSSPEEGLQEPAGGAQVMSVRDTGACDGKQRRADLARETSRGPSDLRGAAVPHSPRCISDLTAPLENEEKERGRLGGLAVFAGRAQVWQHGS
jgi:hypothetical protein